MKSWAPIHASFLASDRTYAARVWKDMLGGRVVVRSDPTRESNAQRNKHNRFIFLETWRLAIDASPLRLIIKIIIISSATTEAYYATHFLDYYMVNCGIGF